MALISCPSCKNEMSSLAERCPNPDCMYEFAFIWRAHPKDATSGGKGGLGNLHLAGINSVEKLVARKSGH